MGEKFYTQINMAQTLDINGNLLSSVGEQVPCKLVNVSNDKGYVELYCLDPVKVGERLQLIINVPKIRTAVVINKVEPYGNSYYVEATPEEGAAVIQAKIIEQKVRGLLR